MNKILLSLIIILSLVGNSYGDSLTNVLANDHKVVINSDGIRMTSKGVVKMPETTTPTATTGSGAVYTKTDNKLYFQDGDGTEHSAVLNDATSIGIGTTSPSTPLHINNTNPTIRLQDSDLTGYSGVSGAGNELLLQSDMGNNNANSSIDFYVDGSLKAIIDDDGNLGIGTTNPSRAIHVVSTAANARIILDEISTANTNYPGYTFNNEGSFEGGLYYSEANDDVRILTGFSGTAPAMVIDSTNNKMGIGVETPLADLHIRKAAPEFLIDNSTGTSGVSIALGIISGEASTGASYLQINAMPLDGTSSAYLQFNRHTDTTAASYVNFYVGNGDATIQHSLASGANSYVCANNGNYGVGTASPTTFKLQVAGNIGPNADNTYSLGNGTYRMSTIYANTGTINTSDERLKNVIKPIDKAKEFLSQVTPIVYRYKDQVSGDQLITDSKVYFGLKAQEVWSVLQSLGYDPEYVGGVDKTVLDAPMTYLEADGTPFTINERYGLRYGEIVSVLVSGWQEHEKEITTLKSQIKSLEDRLLVLEGKVQ